MIVDKERFNTLLADMDKITDQDIKSLNQLRKQYPYFQNQYVMIAKALKKRNHAKTDAFIKKAAIYSADRALLKAIIMDEHDFAPVVEETVASTAQVETATETVPIVPAPPTVVAQKEVETEEEVKTEKAIVPAPEPAPAKTPVPVQPEVAEAPQVTTQEEVIPPTEEEATPIAATAKADEITPAKPQDNQALIDELEKDLLEIRKKKQLIAKMLEQQEAKQSPSKAAPAKKKAPVAGKSQSELIEKFIRNEPQMGKQKLVHDESDHHHEDLAARYTQEQEEFHTETMAKLMVKQKKYGKAIKVYEKLGLKFPEKRAYFASQIEKVKNRSNV